MGFKKSFFGFERVYEGPGFSEKEDIRKNLKDYPNIGEEDSFMNEVYAGPDMGPECWDEPTEATNGYGNDNYDAEIMLLYAAPEILEEQELPKGRMMDVIPDDTVCSAVYAAPEPGHVSDAEPKEPPMGLIYATPDLLRRRGLKPLDAVITQEVYAAPKIPSGPRSFDNLYNDIPYNKGRSGVVFESTRKICNQCGTANDMDSKFCKECGCKFPGGLFNV